MNRRLLIVDLYEGDRVLNLAVMAEHVDGVMLKATEGLTINDHAMQHRRRLLDHGGFHVGLYHYSHPELHSPIEEARHFCDVVGTLERKALRPFLDYESPLAAAQIHHPQLGQWARDWNEYVAAHLGCWPLFYSYPSYITGHVRPDRPIGAGLWLASYGRNDGTDHGAIVPPPWHSYVAHQYTSNGLLTGVSGRVDLSHAPRLRPLLAHGIRGL